MESVRLYVGFGGSGLKTLSAFVRKLNAHAEWSGQLETHFAFLLIDTNSKDLEKYRELISEDCQRLGRDPIVACMQTSVGVANFQRSVSAKFQAADHHDRLKDSWFYKGDAPFNAEQFTGSPEAGAGQCPLISTFLAWRYMPELAEKLHSTVEALQRRVTLAHGDQDWTLHTTYVAGLAGGTGRGCWSLLAFKLREELAKSGRECMPVGIFYDASVFGDVMAEDPGRANKMRINSLTGFSELVGWMRNEFDKSPYNFSLPSLERPYDRASDVIDVTRVVADSKGQVLPNVPGQSPVGQALVLFGKSRAGSAARPELYYEIAANAMYNRMVGEIAGSVVNGESFGSIGATSISIPISDIREYVSGYVQKFLPEYFANGVEQDKADEWVKHLTAPIETPAPFTYAAKSEGALIERVLFGVLAHQMGRFNRLDNLLKDKKYNEAATECTRIDAWAESPEGRIAVREVAKRVVIEAYWGRQAASGIVGTGGLLRDLRALEVLSEQEFVSIYGGHDVSGAPLSRRNPVAAALTSLLMSSRLDLQTANGKKESLDIAGFEAKRVLAVKLAKRIEEVAAGLPGASRTEHGATAKAKFDEARKGLLSSGVTLEEAKGISEAARSMVRFRCMDAVKEEVQLTFNQAASELKSLSASLAFVVDELQSRAKSKQSDLASRREELFWTDNDFDSVLSKGADSRFSVELLADQKLQPVANDDALQGSLLEAMLDKSNDRVERAAQQFVGELKHWVLDASQSSDLGNRKQLLRRMLDKGIVELSRDLALPSSFYRKNFGFFGTVRGLIAAWGRRLSERRGVEAEMTRLRRSFRVQFGIEYPNDDHGPAEFQGDQLDQFTQKVCQNMAVSLGNRCDVLFEARRNPTATLTSDVVKIVLPAEDWFSTDDFKTSTETLAASSGLFTTRGAFAVFPTFQRGELGNSFAMLAYAQKNFPDWKSGAGLDEVASLDYYRDPGLTRWLQACEDPNGSSVFETDASKLPLADESFGLGYTFPAFVRNETLRRLRWKPWAQYSAGQQDARRGFALDAVAYAMLDEPADPKFGDALLGVNQVERWHLPALSLRDSIADGETQDKKWQFCRSAYRDDMGDRLPSHPAFKPGEGFTSIRKLFDAVEGDRNPAVEALADEAHLYFGTVLPSHQEQIEPNGVVKCMMRELRARLEVAKAAESGHTQEDYRKLFGDLIERVTFLGALSCKDLAGHYKRRGQG